MSRGRRNRFGTLVHELKRRRVFQVIGIYAVGAFAVLQAAEILVPALHLPEWTMTLLVVAALVGAPFAIGLAWVFDIVPGGIRRTDSEPGDAPPQLTGISSLRAATWSGSARLPAPARAGTAPAGVGALPASAPGDSMARPAAIAEVATPAVAVMPFVNLSPDPENEYFADGITEDVIAQLSKIGSLTVISRGSIMPFKHREHTLREIGAKLGVRTLLDGSVRRASDRVRIVARLVDAETDRNLWAETYDRELTDIFAIQTDVAVHIAAALRAELSLEERSRIQKEPTTSLQAYQLYLQGRHLFIRYTGDGMRRAIAFFRRALEEDPTYALAYASIAMAYADLAETGALPIATVQGEAMEAAANALRLDPTSGEAHSAMAQLKSLWEFDWAGAEAGYRRALELCPNSADVHDLYGRMCSALGRFDEALVLARRARELDPLAHRLGVATVLLRANRWQEAAEEAVRALEFDPDLGRAHSTLGWAYLKQGKAAEGIRELERAVEIAPAETQWLGQLGEALALAGRTDEARKIACTLEERAAHGFVTPYHLAYIYTGLGEHERALDLLERAFEERAAAIYGLKGSFLFAPLRPHPRFQALLERMNLT